MSDSLTKIAIIIPVHNRKKETLNCLRQIQLLDINGMDIATIVVDDGSTDGTSDSIKSGYPKVIILHGDGNLWWTRATKMGVEYALSRESEYILTLNDDVELRTDFLSELVKTSKSYQNAFICGVVCDIDNRNKIVAAARYAKGFLQYNYSGYLAGEDISALPEKEYESDVLSGYAVLIPRKVFEKVNFDEKRFPHHMGDMDLMLRARRYGFNVVINPRAILYTKIGTNYFHNQIIDEPLLQNVKMFFNIRSTVNLRTRWNFSWRHTPYFLGWLSYLFFIFRMLGAIFLKIVLPHKALRKVMSARI